MRTFAITSFVLLGLTNCSTAFQPIGLATARSGTVGMRASRPDLHEFDFILGEGNSQMLDGSQQQTTVHSRRKIQLPSDGTPDERVTVLASSTFAAPGMEADVAGVEEEADPYADPYADVLEESSPLARYEQKELTFIQSAKNRVSEMDFQDIIATLCIPAVLTAYGLRWGLKKTSGKVSDTTDETLDAFATEMVYHDGDFEEMKLCLKAYNRKLVFLGPNKSSIMLKKYLQFFSKRVTIRPKTISSLSYVLSLFGMSEVKAAKMLVEVCQEMGDRRPSSVGKMLFLGNRILKSDEAKQELSPIRDVLQSSYGEYGEELDDLIEMSQDSIAHAAYKKAITDMGRKQTTTSLPPGWEVLGLDEDTAMLIFEEAAAGGFASDIDQQYGGGGQAAKYDEAGNALDEDGNLLDPENARPVEEKIDIPASGVMECGECGFTLFIAKGREEKQFGRGFRCPECQCGRDKFEPRE